jgi:hypothetical protein
MYTNEKISLMQIGDGAAKDLSAASVSATSYLVGSQLMINRVMAHVSVVTNGASVVEVKQRPLQGSAVGEVVIATLNIPDATAAGKIVYKDFDPVNMVPGDELVYEVSSAATSGSAHFLHEVDNDPEEPSEQADMVESV